MGAPAFEELAVGAELDPQEYGPLTRTDFVRYQGASGDFNPIHHDEEFARAAGFPSVFSVGMLQAGILATYATDRFGPEHVRAFGVRFREQVWPGDRLVCSGRVAGLDDAARTVELELEARRVGGGVAVTATATFVVP